MTPSRKRACAPGPSSDGVGGVPSSGTSRAASAAAAADTAAESPSRSAPHELDRAAVREAGLLLDAADGRRGRAPGARPGDELVGEAGLADPGLAFEHHEPPVRADRRVDVEQRAPLPLAADERERRPGGPGARAGRRGRAAATPSRTAW